MMQATPIPPTAGQEWRTHWLLVLASTIGLSFGAVASSSLGLFMEPLQREFGWSREQIGYGLTIAALIGTPLSPFAGALVDRFGPRMNAMPGMLVAALGFAGFGLVSGNYLTWLLAWVVYSFLALGIKTTVWTTAVSGAFAASRGMALAFVLAGLGMAQSFAPVAAHWLIEGFGWRLAYVGLAVGWGGLALLLIVLFFRDPLSERKASPGKAAGPMPGGLTLAEACRSGPLIRISLAIFLQAIVGTAAIVHLVPILATLGVSRMQAASIAILLGAGSMVGKLLTGWLADRWKSDLLSTSCFALPAIGYLLLSQEGASIPLLALATFLVGYGMGSAFQMVGYLFTHYAGLLHFGKIFGLLGSFTGLGAGIGPPVAGRIFDLTGGYGLFLTIAMAQGVISGLIVYRLGPYPKFEPSGGPVMHAAA